MKRKTFDSEGGLHTAFAPSSSEAFDDDPVLESKHKIFLSHSGAQKELVDLLCEALEERCHYPFFDRRPESLPKGKKFPELILKAAQQCQLFVVVVSEEYFMSKWPMIELNAFVKATKERKSSMNPGILPLFYGLSVSELKDEKRRQRWFKAWEKFAREDVRGLIKVHDWKCALEELTKFNGLPYDRDLKQVVKFRNEIVSHICNLVTPDIKQEDSHVQGNLHEVVIEKVKQIGASQLGKVKVVGLYGVGGIGKTTVCKTLYNKLSNAFEGRVCHIQFGKSSNFKELLQKVLIKLTKISHEAIQHLDEDECKHVLYKNIGKQKTFLAIDNVWDNDNSSKQALVFLDAPFHLESLVLVTSRVQKTLKYLGVDGSACFEMPELGQGDATNLFLHHAAKGQQFTSDEDMDFINRCVRRCYFFKGNERSFHYHPLALEVLGRQLCQYGKEPSKWKEVLSSVWNFSKSLQKNDVFDVMRMSFDLLQSTEQDLFMDVAIFSLHPNLDPFAGHHEIILLDRLCAIYKSQQDLQHLLDSLKRKGLLQDVDLSLGRISMHDLYHEFALLEAKRKLDENLGIGNQRWMCVHVQNGDVTKLEVTPSGRCWENLTRFSIVEDDGDGTIPYTFNSKARIVWQYFSNVQVLQLVGLKSLKGTLNLTGMTHLQSLQVHDLFFIERLKGLRGLKNLTLFELYNSSFCSDDFKPLAIMGQFPKSLKYLDIFDDWGKKGVSLDANVFDLCTNLCKLALEHIKVGVLLDLRNCSSLEHVELFFIEDLETLLLPSRRVASNLQSLNVRICYELVDIQGLEKFVGLEHLHLDLDLSKLKEVPNLLSLTNLQTLTMRGRRDFIELQIPRQLQELHYTMDCKSIQVSNLSGFNQLQVLDLRESNNLAYISEIGDLPALRILNLSNCYCLRRLPNLSKLRSLEELDLDGCLTLELHEEDIQMLATLPLLHPVYFSFDLPGRNKLDPSRRKALHYLGTDGFFLKSSLDWMEGEWEEKKLGTPPIKLLKDVSLESTRKWDILRKL